MIKLAGIILVSGAISLASSHKASLIKNNIRIRKELYEFVLHIKGCIETSSTELSEIYRTYTSETLQKTGFLQILSEADGNSFEYALKNSSLFLPGALFSIYLNLAGILGKSRSGKTEAENLSRYLAEIEKEEEKLIKSDESKIVLYRKLGILAGILAALTFI